VLGRAFFGSLASGLTRRAPSPKKVRPTDERRPPRLAPISRGAVELLKLHTSMLRRVMWVLPCWGRVHAMAAMRLQNERS
jgi:hypothetical protein